MAGLMERTMTIIKARYSKLLNRAERPSETLDYSYERQLELLQNVKRGVADQMADTGAAIQRARDKTEEMQSRADAIDELTASGALEDFTSDQTPLDRELAQMASASQVDDELAKLKKEVGSGAPAVQKEIEK